ncbi:MAG: ornithine carbamoyltransferase [Chthoniobacterales bacterium]
MKNFLSIQSLNSEEILKILSLTTQVKAERGQTTDAPLAKETWALIFSKSSTRTRVSFEVGIRELGGKVMFLSSNDIQLGRGEPIRDTARVLGRMIHGAIIRTYAQSDVDEFAKFSDIPTVNALTDEEHPCQILTDLFTIQETRKTLEDLKVCFVGDGDCNVAKSWIWAAARLGFELRIAAPPSFHPPSKLLQTAGGKIHVTTDPREAAEGSDVLYTDVWVSMGKEDESAYRLAQFHGYQINSELLSLTRNPLVMHCLPAYREKEITDTVMEKHAETIFRQAENRLHTQKAILKLLKNSKL